MFSLHTCMKISKRVVFLIIYQVDFSTREVPASIAGVEVAKLYTPNVERILIFIELERHVVPKSSGLMS